MQYYCQIFLKVGGVSGEGIQSLIGYALVVGSIHTLKTQLFSVSRSDNKKKRGVEFRNSKPRCFNTRNFLPDLLLQICRIQRKAKKSTLSFIFYKLTPSKVYLFTILNH